jgi:DNA/RNA endonuclease YhcR with UshA esterase domain
VYGNGVEMFERQERIAVVILIGVLLICGIVTVILESVGKAPFASNYSEKTSVGSLVILEGVVQKVTPIGSGDFCILLINGVQVFLSKSATKVPIGEGNLVSLYGIVTTYKGKREIIVSDRNDIRVIGQSQGKNQNF